MLGLDGGAKGMKISVNLNKLRKKAADIRNAVEKLTTFTTQPVEEHLKDHKNNAASKYYLLVGAEAAIDICNHLAARLAGIWTLEFTSGRKPFPGKKPLNTNFL
ncbi:MAG: HepT-like ribonuclease domain-containing protein [Desulfotomaculales bacterium]